MPSPPLLILFVAVIAANMYRMIDKFMLGWTDNLASLGCYEYADKFIRIPLGFITAFGTVMLSHMTNMFTKKDEQHAVELLGMSGSFVVLLSFAMAFGLAAISPEFIIVFLGDEYQQTVGLLIILCITIPLIGWNNYVRTQILIPTNNDKTYTVAVSVGAAVNFVLNLVFITFWSAEGAAVATIFSYTAVLVIQTYAASKYVKKSQIIRDILFSLISGIILFLVVRLIGNCGGINVVTVVVEIIIGVLVYCILAVLYIYIFYKKYFCDLLRGLVHNNE